MNQVLNVYQELCRGCRICEMACSLKKTNSLGTFKSGIRIFKDDFEGIDLPVVCRQCKDPLCEKACPLEEDKPIRKDTITGIVYVFSDKRCIGCYECVKACPFGAIHIDPEEGKPVKCDLCGGDPECVKWCPYGAIVYGAVSTVEEVPVRREQKGA